MLKALRRRLARLGPALFHLLARTWRIRAVGELPSSAAIVAFWHGDMLPVWKYFADTQSVALISQSRDGGLLADLVGRWGFRTVRGSSSRGGKEALTEIVNAARNGQRVLITPDGPRGPRHVMKRGALLAAHRAGVPLVLCRVNARPVIRGSNWDRFMVPLPFATVQLDFVTLVIAADADRDKLEQLNMYAESSLRHLSPLI